MEQNLIKSEIESRIFTIRGMQVMLDSDLAENYMVRKQNSSTERFQGTRIGFQRILPFG